MRCYFYQTITEEIVKLGKFGANVNQSVSENYLPKAYHDCSSFISAVKSMYSLSSFSETFVPPNTGFGIDIPFDQQIRKAWNDSLQQIKAKNWRRNDFKYGNINYEIRDFPFSTTFEDWKNSLKLMAFQFNFRVEEDLFFSGNRNIVEELEKLNNRSSCQLKNSEESTKEISNTLQKRISNSLFHSLFLIFVINYE